MVWSKSDIVKTTIYFLFSRSMNTAVFLGKMLKDIKFKNKMIGSYIGDQCS